MSTESFTLPELMKKEIDVIPKTGYYGSRSEFIRDAIRHFLKKNSDLRISIAIELYKLGNISLGRACEISEKDYETMKKLILDRGVKIRRGVLSPEEGEEMANKAMGKIDDSS